MYEYIYIWGPRGAGEAVVILLTTESSSKMNYLGMSQNPW